MENIGQFEINLSEEELKKRNHKDYLRIKKLLKKDSPEYQNLSEGDKKALKHLVLAANYLNDVYLKHDNENNIPFRKFLQEKSKKGDLLSQLSLRLFQAQNGIIAVDAESNKIILCKGENETLGKAFYPWDLEKEEFHKILIDMLKEGKKQEVQNILNQRTIVKWEETELVAVDYTEIFKEEFQHAARELEKAAEVSSNSDFNEYLRLQAKALRKNDPMLDAYADKKWAELQDTPLEFTISREQYQDELSGTVVENEELKKLLEENNIDALSKDAIGVRVGIVNKEGTEKLLEIKKYLPLLAENMPFKTEYEQSFLNQEEGEEESKQTMVDVDLVIVTGDEGAYRGGITLAQNLPNNDKLSLKIGGGRRNVYHRQIRKISDYKKLQEKLDAILDKELHQYYDAEADHWFTIGHENAHSLGPKKGTEALGKYKDIIEENKADMASLAMLDLLVEKGMYTDFQRKQIVVSFMADNFLKAKPTLSQAHRVRSVMQTSYFLNNGAISVDEQGILHIEIEKMVPTARKMLEEIIRVQLSQDFSKGEKYVLDNFVWTDEMETIAAKIKKVDKALNGIVYAPLAKFLVEAQ